jgi:methionyl-tRNA formyltransferase
MPSSPRILYFGMEGEFSSVPLAALLEAEIPVAAVVLPHRLPTGPGEPAMEPVPPPQPRGAELPLLGGSPRSLAQLACDHCIPLLAAGRLAAPECLDRLGELQPDLIAVACFPRRLPPALLALPRLGCLNLHPSLLPRYRGPAPLFWMFRAGEATSGVTVHRMTEQLDAGPVVAQEAFPIPEGIAGDALMAACAARGARLLVASVRAAARGETARQPQDEAAATYHPWPAAADFELPTTRPARWAFNFIRGVAAWGQPVILTGGERLPVLGALAYSLSATLPAPYIAAGSELHVQFTPGVLMVHPAGLSTAQTCGTNQLDALVA